MSTLFEALTIAVGHHQANRLESAEQLYRQILAVEPAQADALHLLGVIASQRGAHASAIDLIAQAIAVRGDVADYHNNLGVALHALGRTDEAIHSFERAIALQPDHDKAHNGLGIALMERRRPSEAVRHFRRAIELRPESAEAYGHLGAALGAQGELTESASCLWRALELEPHHGPNHERLGDVLWELGRLEDAGASYLRAVNVVSDKARIYCKLGALRKEHGRLDESIGHCRQALAIDPGCKEAHNNLGNALREQGKLEQATACYQRAIDTAPDYAEALSNLGCVRAETGDLAGAAGALREAVRQNPQLAEAHYYLATFLGGAIADNDAAAMRRLALEPSLKDAERMQLHFGLAYLLDCRGAHAEAATHMDRANALQRSEWRRRGMEYDPNAYASLVDEILDASTPEFFERVRGSGSETDVPIFVFGLPRTGSTLIEQILASHSRVHGAGEAKLARWAWSACSDAHGDCFRTLHQLDRGRVSALAMRALERLRAHDPAALRVVDKTPDNFCSLGLLAALFPNAKLIHCRRDLRDTATSCWMTRFAEVRWASDAVHIASQFREHQRIMDHWREVLPVPILEVDYEETVADLENVARKLMAWCALPWEPECLQFHKSKRPVRTASMVQVRKPVYRTSVGRWKNYERLLAPLFAALRDHGLTADAPLTIATPLAASDAASYAS